MMYTIMKVIMQIYNTIRNVNKEFMDQEVMTQK